MSDSDNDINDDRFQEMGQVMTGISGRMDELANPCDFQFDLQEAFKKLAIATKEPSDENFEALEATFGDLGQLIKILLSKKHTAEEAAILLAAGMRSTKMSIDNDMDDHKEGARTVHLSPRTLSSLSPPLPSSGNSMASRHLCMSYSSARI